MLVKICGILLMIMLQCTLSSSSDLDWNSIKSEFHERYDFVNTYFCHDKDGNILSYNDGNYFYEFENNRFKMVCRVDSSWCYDFKKEELMFKENDEYIIFSIEENSHLLTYKDTVYDLKSVRKQVWESKKVNEKDSDFYIILDLNVISVKTISTNHIYWIKYSLPDTSFLITMSIPFDKFYTISVIDGNIFTDKFNDLGITYSRSNLSFVSSRNIIDSLSFIFSTRNSRISRFNNILSYINVSFEFVPFKKDYSIPKYRLTLFNYNIFGRLRKNEIDLNFCE